MIQLIITLDDKGLFQVRGPVEDKVLCYGLLETAKDEIRQYKAPANGIIAEAPLPNGVRLKGN